MRGPLVVGPDTQRWAPAAPLSSIPASRESEGLEAMMMKLTHEPSYDEARRHFNDALKAMRQMAYAFISTS